MYKSDQRINSNIKEIQIFSIQDEVYHLINRLYYSFD